MQVSAKLTFTVTATQKYCGDQITCTILSITLYIAVDGTARSDISMHLNGHAVSHTSFKNVCSVESSHNFVIMQTFETDIKCFVVHVQCCPFNPALRTSEQSGHCRL